MRMLDQSLTKVFLAAVVYVTFVVANELSQGEKVATHIPHFLTKPSNLYVGQGETVNLECSVHNLDPYTRIWYKGSEVLFVDELRVISDTRFNLNGDSTLSITKFDKGDEGDYICSLSTKPSDTILVHKVHLKVPVGPVPTKITKVDPVHYEKQFMEGSTVMLPCIPDGKPQSKVKWTSEDAPLSDSVTGKLLHDGTTLKFDNIQQTDSRRYECSVLDNVGRATVQTIYMIKVLAKPVISNIEYGLTSEGNTAIAILTCKTTANPPPKISWYRSGVLVEPKPNDRYEVKASGRKHSSLLIKDVQKSDYGVYKCIAENEYGNDEKMYNLTGIPGRVQFKSSTSDSNTTSYELRFATLSTEQIIQYTLVLCNTTSQVNEKRICNNVIIPAIEQMPPRYSQSYVVEGLQPASKYEVVMWATNSYGSSPRTDVFNIHTAREPTVSVPSSDNTTNDGDIMTTESEINEEPAVLHAAGHTPIDNENLTTESKNDQDEKRTSGLTNHTNGAPAAGLQQRARIVAIMTVVILIAFF